MDTLPVQYIWQKAAHLLSHYPPPYRISASLTFMKLQYTWRFEVGGLPVELWFQIIDIVVRDIVSWRDGNVRSCALVCRTWYRRIQHHLSPIAEVTIRSENELRALSMFLRASPLKPRTIREITIDPEDKTKCQWIASVPLLLPRLFDIHVLIFRRIDLGQQHMRFPQLYSLYCPELLYVQKPICTQWPQITRLITSCKVVDITSRRFGEGSGVSPLMGPFRIRAPNLERMWWRAAWDEISEISLTWRFSAPKLEILTLSLNTVKPDDGRVWLGIVELFHSPLSLPALHTVEIFIYMYTDIKLQVEQGGEDRRFSVQFPTAGFTYASSILSGLSALDPFRIAIRLLEWPNSYDKTWHTLDNVLSDRRHYKSLTAITITIKQDAAVDPVCNRLCIVDVFRCWLPKCVERALLPQKCNPNRISCHVHPE
ncbi:hypothetical protein BXZ70DRAFT_486521 [Cristinia sonorae]|uniref:F-box domain-containing protein n=1 Tax=Cristinia sonorae TaxID=1940300 RepID=A0A8K0UJE1_9AGAR|nr:hypothetical protein BXZ70DRAFT_486521 [Cristinia sonorae]